MTKVEAVFRYKAAMAAIKEWYRNGAITADDLDKLSGIIAQKYGLSLSSIYLDMTCYVRNTERICTEEV